MNAEKVIQSQIRLIAFKAVKVSLVVNPEPSKEEAIPKFDLDLKDLTVPQNPNQFVKVFLVDLVTQTDKHLEVTNIKLEYHALFECAAAIEPNFFNSDFVKISAPAIGFPYIRSFISTITAQAGLPGIILPSINFVQFSKFQKETESSI